jgi:Universal stress protein UspA and related nucleotide-binding proteins
MNVVPLNAVIVGLDRSDPGRAAVEYAADLANRRHLPLRLLHAFEPSQYADRTTIGWREDVVALRRNSAQRLVDDTLEVLGILYPDLDVSAALHFGSATDMLIKASKDAHTVVLGSRGAGGFADLVIGSTTLHVTAHAKCPVIAVPGPPYAAVPRHGVVVGVDGSQLSEAAIGYAFEAASDVGEKLTAVHAWYDPAHTGVGVMMPLGYDPTMAAREERLVMAESMAGWQEKFPDVEVEHLVVLGHPVPSLVSRATHARLLVVGSRGRSAVHSLVLGSVSHGVLHHATGPVAVVRT